jgi:hypothetical protein
MLKLRLLWCRASACRTACSCSSTLDVGPHATELPGSVLAGGIKAVALDEADKMLSLGFAPQLQRLHALLLAPAGGKGSRQKRPQVY